MLDKPELKDLIDKLVDKFDLESNSRNGIIDGDELKDKLVEFIYNTTKESLDERKKKFAETLKPYVDTYGRDMLNKFYFYWSATKGNGYKMLFEREKSWLLGMRLDTWAKNNVKFNAVNMVSKLK